MDKPSLRMRVTVEAVGTFGFFFIGFMGIAAAITYPGSIGTAGVAVGFGGGLALMIFAFGHISGGHYNPGVSLGLAVEAYGPAKHAKAAPFKRNDAMLEALPIGVLVAPGSGIQANLADKARRLGIPVWKLGKGGA